MPVLPAGTHSPCRIVASKVDLSSKGNIQFCVRVEHLINGVPHHVNGYLFLTKNDGRGGQEPNTVQVESLQEALGWDGVDLKGLHETDWSQREVSAVVEDDEYNGKVTQRIAFLNPVGGFRKTKDEDLNAALGAWGQMNHKAASPAQQAAKKF